MQVPLQTTPSVQLEAGGEVQYGATGIEPYKDYGTDDIKRFGKAAQQFGQTLNKLDNELSDAEGKRLANDYATEIEALGAEYDQLQGSDAVGTIEVDGEQVPVFEHYQSRAKAIYDSHAEKASSGTVKYIFENKASVYTRSLISDMTKHSLKQQRLYHEAEVKKELEHSQNAAKVHFEDWNNPDGEFRKFYAIGLAKIQEQAQLKGWNIDPEKEDANGNKIGISSQYIDAVETYNMDIATAVYKSLRQKKDNRGAQDFMDWLDREKQSKQLNEMRKVNKDEAIDHGNSKCVDSIISNNGDQNDGSYSSQSQAVLCLSSNQTFEHGNGGSVIDGENSDEVNTTDKTQSENLEALDQRRSTSKFFSSESSLRGTLIPQHQTTHLFAIQKLGVEKADSLYTKAKSSIEIDQEKFKTDREYANEINGKIIDNYNELIIEACEKKYKPEIVKLEKQIEDARNEKGMGRSFQKRKTEKVNKLLAELDKAEEEDPKYVEKIVNDLEVIKNNINYDFSSEEETIKIDPKTGLQPIEVLKAKLKATITDPKELATATKDLEIKYNKIKTEREAAYNQALEQAQEIAFAEGNGWKNLAANNIDINDFTKEDQEILRNGPPEESNVDTEVELIDNPAEVRDNLNAYRPNLSATQFKKFKQLAASLDNENNYVEATGNTTLLKATLSRMDMGHLWTSDKKKDKAQYIAINDAWIKEINARQITKGNVKLTLGEKQAALVHVLMDKVNVDNWLRDEKNVNVHLVDQDRLEDVFVKIKHNGKTETVFTSKIPAEPGNDVLALITDSLRRSGIAVTQKAIAEYWVKLGRPKNEAEANKNALTYGEEN